jgi:thioredoxin 1
MSNLKVFAEDTFQTEVLESERPVLVVFFATWCGPCKMMAPVVHQLADEFASKITVGELDVDQAQSLAQRYQVMGVPTLAIFEGGQIVDRMVGFPGPAAVRDFVEKHAVATA